MPGLTRDGGWANGSGSRRKKIACRWKRSPTSWRVSTVVLSNSSAMSRRISTAITMCICSPRFIPSSRPLPARRALRYALTARWRRRVGSTSRRRAAAPASAASFTAKRSLRNCFCRRWMPPSARGERSLEVMCHPAYVDRIIMGSAYCYPRLDELDVLTSASLKGGGGRAGLSSGNLPRRVSPTGGKGK